MNLTLQYLQWQFVERPKEILKAIKNFLSFGAYFFSIKQTIASLFAPWKISLGQRVGDLIFKPF